MLGCPNCLSYSKLSTTSSTTERESCQLCDRLHNNTENNVVVHKNELRLNKRCKINTDWKRDKEILITRQYEMKPVYNCVMTNNALSVVRWSSESRTFFWFKLIWIVMILFPIVTASFTEKTLQTTYSFDGDGKLSILKILLASF